MKTIKEVAFKILILVAIVFIWGTLMNTIIKRLTYHQESYWIVSYQTQDMIGSIEVFGERFDAKKVNELISNDLHSKGINYKGNIVLLNVSKL